MHFVLYLHTYIMVYFVIQGLFKMVLKNKLLLLLAIHWYFMFILTINCGNIYRYYFADIFNVYIFFYYYNVYIFISSCFFILYLIICTYSLFFYYFLLLVFCIFWHKIKLKNFSSWLKYSTKSVLLYENMIFVMFISNFLS